MASKADEYGSSSSVENAFNWLSRAARGSAYVSYTEFSHKAACSFDFGYDGYAASCNDGGKLLHMTAKSAQSGIVFAQGNFESTLYSSLARAQRTYGGQSTFGLELPESPEPFNLLKETGSALRLGEMIERGSFNHRWPFNEYALISNFGPSEDDETESEAESPSIREGGSIEGEQNRPSVSEREVGTCAVLSFVKDGILYQTMRLEASTRWEADGYYIFPFFGKVILEIGGPVKFREFDQSSPKHTTSHLPVPRMPFQTSGQVPDILPHRCSETGGMSLLDCWDDPAIELDIRVHRLGMDGEIPLELPLRHTSDKGIGYFETEADLTYDDWKARKAGSFRTVTFMASFRLRDKTTSVWPDIPTSEEIYKHIGISSSEPTAVAAMWETIFAQRERATGRISELSEDRLVARCLEKILHVDLIPASFEDGGLRRYPEVEIESSFLPESAKGSHETELIKRVNRSLKRRLRNTPLALVSNLFLQPNVDLKALFWKVRFLVKAYEFLLTFAVSQPTGEPGGLAPPSTPLSRVTTTIHDMCDDPDFHLVSKDLSCMKYASYYQSRIIRNRIELVVQYLIQALLQPNSDTPLLPDNILAFEPNYYYVMMTLCYVSKKSQLLKFKWPSLENMASWDKADSVLCNRIPADNDNFNPAFKEKVLLLKWYHYGSIRELVEEKLIPSSWMDGLASNTVYRLKRDAVRSAKTKLSSHAPYLAEDEILDRLAFLAWPLGLEDRVSSDFCPATLASITAKRIRERDFTREINTGTLTSGCGPWEIHALCHHSRLMVSNYLYKRGDHRSKDEKMDEVDKYRQKLCNFITAESSVVPCWERTNLATRRGWLRSEATSVVGSTLLEICQKDFELLEEERARDSDEDVAVQPGQALQCHPQYRVEDKSCPPIDWKQYRPPNKYHPEDFFNSLEDTPELYRYDRVAKMQIPPSLRLHLSPGGVSGKESLGVDLEYLTMAPKFSSDSIRVAISSTSISVIDLTAHKSEQSESASRKASHQYRVCIAGALRIHASESWCKKLQGPVLPGGCVRERPGTADSRREEARVVGRLSDSLVDKGVQHRILAVKSSRDRSLVVHFVYVFHPESADAFSDNIFKISQFSCKYRDTWSTDITLRSWTFARTVWSFPEKPCEAKSAFFGPTMVKSEVSPEDAPIELPLHLHEALRKSKPKIHDLEDREPGQILLCASSIVLSTNDFGDFSKCSIISELISEVRLQQLEREVPILWQRFIHQPQTGRCLVFLSILGQLCQAIALQHQKAIGYLTSIINIEDHFLRGEQDWLTDQRAIGKLQLALWSLESLFKLRNTLAGTLATIKEAKIVLLAQIGEGPGKRSPALESYCQYSIETFERNLGLLEALYIKIDRRTELGSRYRDSLSTVLSLNDSRSALQQSTTIQKLTYLTIAYLPVGLSAAIFAIPDEQKVVVPAMGRKWFLLCILILFVFTAMTAILMGSLLSFLDKIRRHFRKVWGFGSDLAPNFMMVILSWGRWKQGRNQHPPRIPEKDVTSSRGSQNGSLEGINPVESSTRSTLGRVLTPSLTRRKSHLDDVETGKLLRRKS